MKNVNKAVLFGTALTALLLRGCSTRSGWTKTNIRKIETGSDR